MLNEAGGVIDDLIAYRTSEREFFLVVNASMIREDWDHFQKLTTEDDDVQMANASAHAGGLAVQGPKSRAVVRSRLRRRWRDVSRAEHDPVWQHERRHDRGSAAPATRVEEGFEFFMPASEAEAWFRKIIDAVKAEGGGRLRPRRTRHARASRWAIR